MLISYEKPLRSRTKQGISLLLVFPPLNRIQQVTMGNEFGIEVHGKLSWKPFRARCRMAQRANGTRSACRKLFSWHSSAPKSFPLVFPLVMPSSTSVASSARPQVQGATERKAPVLRVMALQSFYPGNLFSYLYLYLPMPPLLPIFARLPASQQLAAWNQNTGTKGVTKEKKTWTHHTHPLKSSVNLENSCEDNKLIISIYLNLSFFAKGL